MSDRYVSPTHEELCLLWRQSLSDEHVRQLAAEYLRGARDPENVDAHQEYLVRFKDGTKAPAKPKKRRKGSASAYK